MISLIIHQLHANKYYLITFAYVKLCKRNKWKFYARVKAPVKPAGECQLFTHYYVGLMNERENRFLHDWEHITIYTYGLTQTIKTFEFWTWRRILKIPIMGPTNCPGLAGNPRPGLYRTLETIPCRVCVSFRLMDPGPCRWGCPSTVNSPSTCTSDGRGNRCWVGPSIMMPMGRTTRWDRPSSYRIILKVSNQFDCQRNQYLNMKKS